MLPPVLLGLRKVCGLLAQESRKNPEGESELSPSGFSLLSPDALHPGWRLRRRARSLNGAKPGILLINSERLFSRQTRQHPPTRVQGDHPPGRVWAESPAYPLCLLCDSCFLPFTQMLLRFQNANSINRPTAALISPDSLPGP